MTAVPPTTNYTCHQQKLKALCIL